MQQSRTLQPEVSFYTQVSIPWSATGPVTNRPERIEPAAALRRSQTITFAQSGAHVAGAMGWPAGLRSAELSIIESARDSSN